MTQTWRLCWKIGKKAFHWWLILHQLIRWMLNVENSTPERIDGLLNIADEQWEKTKLVFNSSLGFMCFTPLRKFFFVWPHNFIWLDREGSIIRLQHETGQIRIFLCVKREIFKFHGSLAVYIYIYINWV